MGLPAESGLRLVWNLRAIGESICARAEKAASSTHSKGEWG